VLFDDRGFRGVVMRLGSAFAKVRRSDETLHVGAAARLSHVMNHACRSDLSGFELAAGIPGTIGGALVMNAGTPHWRIGDRCEEVQVLDLLGREQRIPKAEAGFGYRQSGLSQYLVLSARFRLTRGHAEAVSETMARVRAQRRSTQPWRKKSAGCVFKNPPEESAGRLLDSLGFKGKRVGGAVVSRRHANFILNDGTATASDYLALIEMMRDTVQNRCGITLEQEVVQVTPWGIHTKVDAGIGPASG
jgi:UDP-N-acetylmuramate dehydrogenase